MIPKSFIDEITQTIHNILPEELVAAKADIKVALKARLHEQFQEWQLITREEFELQENLLARTRAKIDQLEKTVAELELCVDQQNK